MKTVAVTGGRITGDDVVFALKAIGRTVEVAELAKQLGTTDTRAVATASRKPRNDGRIRMTYNRHFTGALYRFVRMKAR